MELFIPGDTNRKLYIMRGIPGCGKTHRAKQLAPAGQIFSADNFFGEGEEYRKNWKAERTHLAHRDCEAQLKAAMRQKVSPVVVDNTNVNLSALRVYLDMGMTFVYEVYLAYPNSPWWEETVRPFLSTKTPQTADAEYDAVVAEIIDKNTHGVPAEHLRGMLQRWTWPTVEDYVESIESRIAETERATAELRRAVAYLKENSRP